jgi:hypothetical protein
MELCNSTCDLDYEESLGRELEQQFQNYENKHISNLLFIHHSCLFTGFAQSALKIRIHKIQQQWTLHMGSDNIEFTKIFSMETDGIF